MGKAKASLSSELLRDNHGRYAEEVALALFGCNGRTRPLQKTPKRARNFLARRLLPWTMDSTTSSL
jgi:hypothetical protein